MKKFITALIFALLPAHAFAQAVQPSPSGLADFESSLNQATRNNDNTQLVSGVYGAVARFLNERVFQLLISSAIALAVLFIFYGAMQYFTAYGDENKATNAKKTLSYAFLGLVIAFMSMGIAGLVQQSVTNSQALQASQAPVL